MTSVTGSMPRIVEPMTGGGLDPTRHVGSDAAGTAARVAADDASRDRARGALVGLAAGDAVGTTLEFRAPGTFEPIADMVGGGPFRLPAGAWTDDTSMAIALAESIVDTGRLDLADQLRRYLLWRDHGRYSSTGRCFDIGNTTTTQLTRFANTGEPVDPVIDESSAANGSLMRLAPVPIAWHGDPAFAAAMSGESSRSTHPATRPVDSCRLMGAMVAALIGGATWDAVTAPSFWQNVGGSDELHPQVAAIAEGSYRRRQPPEIRGTGFCIDALEAALWAVDGATDFREAVLRAANLGDDADTTAAIAGQLAGARWGFEAIPADWRGRLVQVERLVSLADAAFDRAAAGADADRAPRPPVPWAHDALLHAWWVVPGKVLAGEYPTDREGHTHRLEVLLDAGIRTFVDLTTPDDGLTTYAAPLDELAAIRRIDVRHHAWPIPDLGVIDLAGYRRIVDDIRNSVAAGRPVFVHCWGGVGRTGTVVGCVLAEQGSGVPVDTVIEQIGALRAGTRKASRPAPETSVQRTLLSEWLSEWLS